MMIKFTDSVVVYLICLFFYSCSFERLRNTEFDSTLRTSTIATADVDFDGRHEMVVAALDGPNLILKYDGQRGKFVNVATLESSYNLLMETEGRTISVCACDLDGDGREEIYIQNTNSPFDTKPVPDKIYKWLNNSFVDLFGQIWNKDIAPRYGGHSVSCVDYVGDGKYAFIVTTYVKEGRGSFRMLAMNNDHPVNNPTIGSIVISDVTEAAGLSITRDGHGIAVGPLFGNDGRSDLIITSDNRYYIGSSTFRHIGDNAVMRNNGNRTFTNVAEILGLSDGDENGRSVSMMDFNNDGLLDIMYLNWLGPNRMLIQNKTGTHIVFNWDFGNDEFARAGPSEIMLISDLDNDGNLDIVMNSADEDSIYQTSNQLFSINVHNGSEVTLSSSSFNNSVLEKLQIKGISAGDLNANGILELYVSHKSFEGRTLSVFEMHSSYNWIRIFPKCKTGASAKGTAVKLTNSDEVKYQRIIGEGCGYKCHLEPAAHFGLGTSFPKRLHIQWSDGHTVTNFLGRKHVNKTLVITYTGRIDELLSDMTDILPTSTAISFCGTFWAYVMIPYHLPATFLRFQHL